MIISASRRTDIPAFYAPWFMERLRQGYCLVPNPYDRGQIARISLAPRDVDCIVFWTRLPQGLKPYLRKLERGYASVFMVSLTGLPRMFEPKRPPVATAVRGILDLAAEIGPGRIVWRYDPVLLSEATPPAFHVRRFAELARSLEGATHRVKVSLFEAYRKTRPRLAALAGQGGGLLAPDEQSLRHMLRAMSQIARDHGMTVTSCAQGQALMDCGIAPGACVDASWLEEALGLRPPQVKDPAQRKECRCVASRDIGMYDTCLFGCGYCYATSSRDRALARHRTHDPRGPALLPLPPAMPRRDGRLPLPL